jgi:hypothetical protein
MNQLYAEAGVKRKDTAATMGLRALMIIGVLIGLFFMLIGQLYSYIGVIIIVAVFFFYPKLSVEYEYVFVDGQIDFDKIIGKAKRKNMLRIDFDQIDIMAPINSASLDSFNHVQMEKKDFSSLGKDSKPYVIIASTNSKKMRIIFEPSEKMLAMIKQKNPRKIITY